MGRVRWVCFGVFLFLEGVCCSFLVGEVGFLPQEASLRSKGPLLYVGGIW